MRENKVISLVVMLLAGWYLVCLGGFDVHSCNASGLFFVNSFIEKAYAGNGHCACCSGDFEGECCGCGCCAHDDFIDGADHDGHCLAAGQAASHAEDSDCCSDLVKFLPVASTDDYSSASLYLKNIFLLAQCLVPEEVIYITAQPMGLKPDALYRDGVSPVGIADFRSFYCSFII